VHFLALEQLNRICDREPGLTCACRPGPENQCVAPQGADIGVLRRGARAHGALAQIDLLEAWPRGSGVVVESRTLCDCQTDRAFDVAGHQLVAARELLV